MGTLANRYRGQGVYYEIENEVNGEAFWKGTLEEYLELLRVGYYVIKKADPQAKVLSFAMGCGIVRISSRKWYVRRHGSGMTIGYSRFFLLKNLMW